MKIRQCFVSNSSTSSFLVTDKTKSLDQVKNIVKKLAIEHNYNFDNLRFYKLSSFYCLSSPDMKYYLPIFNNLNIKKPWNSDEYLQASRNNDFGLADKIEARIEYENDIKINKFLSSRNFLDDYYSMIHIIGNENDQFIYETLDECPELEGEYVHMGQI
jgi:hypothetical protein